MKVIIIGAGEVGYSYCKRLFPQENDVIIIVKKLKKPARRAEET